MPSSTSLYTGLPRREKANSGRPRSFPTSALTKMTSDMAATATVNRKASSTVGAATSSASLENIKLMPKITAEVSAASSDSVCVFFCVMSRYLFFLCGRLMRQPFCGDYTTGKHGMI